MLHHVFTENGVEIQHRDSALPVNTTKVPSKREALEALAMLESVAKDAAPRSCEVIRQFILTR